MTLHKQLNVCNLNPPFTNKCWWNTVVEKKWGMWRVRHMAPIQQWYLYLTKPVIYHLHYSLNKNKSIFIQLPAINWNLSKLTNVINNSIICILFISIWVQRTRMGSMFLRDSFYLIFIVTTTYVTLKTRRRRRGKPRLNFFRKRMITSF